MVKFQGHVFVNFRMGGPTRGHFLPAQTMHYYKDIIREIPQLWPEPLTSSRAVRAKRRGGVVSNGI